MNRSLSRPGSGINEGIRGLWGHVCGPFLTILSSQVSVLSCGLLVLDSSGVQEQQSGGVAVSASGSGVPAVPIIELTANEPPQAHDVGAVTVRSVTVLGSKVTKLVRALFANPSSISGSAAPQRILKLIRDLSSSRAGAGADVAASIDSEEQLWLVPIINGKAVVAVLRIALKVMLI